MIKIEMPAEEVREVGLIGDFFCGAGGASLGIEQFCGRPVDFAINHDKVAIGLHSRNHPSTYHMTEDIFTTEIENFVSGRKVSLLWASPDCTHFSRAKGKTPRKASIRMLPFAIYFHADKIRPEVICMENVTEIQGWCPIEDREDQPGYGQPVKELKGVCYECFVSHMTQGRFMPDGRPYDVPKTCKYFCDKCQVVKEHYNHCLGYEMEWKELCAADYGAPTTRRRWYAILRCDNRPIRWPLPTHSKEGAGNLQSWVPASSVLDLEDYGQSIFGRKKPLAENTLKRIAKGLEKFVFHDEKPFLIHVNHSGEGFRGQSLEEPLPTLTRKLGMGVVNVKTMEMEQFLLKYYKSDVGQPLDIPLHTVTTSPGHFGLITVRMADKEASVDENILRKASEVSQFLLAYYGKDIGQELDQPLRTIVTKDRFSLVTVVHSNKILLDICLRMLSPDELKRGNGFSDDYDISHDTFWHRIPIHEQTAKIGNAVVPVMAQSIVEANCPYLKQGERIPFVKISQEISGQYSFA